MQRDLYSSSVGDGEILSDFDRCHINCSMCGDQIGQLWITKEGRYRKPNAAPTINEDHIMYEAKDRIPLECVRCNRRYYGHTPRSLMRRALSGHQLEVPY